MKTTQQINVMGIDIQLKKVDKEDYISLTDMVKKIGDEAMIYNRMRNRNTVEFIGGREELYNPIFKGNEFETFKKEAGLNSFNLTPRKRVEATNAIGIVSKAGRYGGGTFAHKDIAFEFATRISPKFKLYLIKEFQRLKEIELKTMDRNVKRFLTKVNYKIHTDAIKEHLLPLDLLPKQQSFVYADEADLLNVALFGKTVKERRDQNPDVDGNMRDEASIEQLIILANLESMNAELIASGLLQSQRIVILNKVAITQMKSLLQMDIHKSLPSG